jgi:ABC-type antimicrobial peptide transport system permease subunit
MDCVRRDHERRPEESHLFGIRTADPLTLIVVGVVLAGVAATAALIPALRATRVDPTEVLRYE